jgi:hypothetical protein
MRRASILPCAVNDDHRGHHCPLYAGGDVLGSWIFGLSLTHGFRYWVIAITVTYALILPVIPFVPEQITATADGEPNPEDEASVVSEVGKQATA